MLHVSVLGPVEISRDGARIPLNGQHQRVLVAFLAMELGKVVPTARLIEAIWADRPPRHARVKLQGCVSALRKALGEGVPSDGSGRSSIVTHEPGYAMSQEWVTTDLSAYRARVRQAADEISAGDVAAAAVSLAASLALWRGPAFADARTAVTDGLANALERGRLLAVERKAACDLRLGRHEEVAEELTSVLAANPFHERARALLMLALYRCACRAEALQCYLDGRRQLRDQLGIEPGPALRRLHQRILCDDPGLMSQATLEFLEEAADGH